MAVVQPFRALRYDTGRAGPLERLVSPPYDVLDGPARDELAARSPYNIVHLTLPDGEGEAARTLEEWRGEGILRRDDAPAFWALEQDYVGPDGVARTRTGLVAALRLEPYDRRVVLPHERTHAGPKEGRLRLLRATRTQLEPIFLLHPGARPFEVPERDPDMAVEGTRAWRLEPGATAGAFDGLQLLIADGHHRYETALAFHDEDAGRESAWQMVVLVAEDDPGLTIFPTHRLVRGAPRPDMPGDALEDALVGLDAADPAAASAVLYRDGRAWLVQSGDAALDAEVVTGDIVRYTPDRDDAVAAVDAGEADAAWLLRPPRLADVWAIAREGGVMPQKSTYFFPKLLSGLLLQPLD